MKYQELREKVKNHPKYEGCVEVARAPLINEGFPGTFNLSFTEYDWLREYGRYVDFDHDYVFSTVQSCIRLEDFQELRGRNSWKYLGVFEIADLTGIINLSEKPDYQRLQRKQIADLILFLRNIGIAPERIHSSYNAGGQVSQLTQGKYNFEFHIPEDTISKAAFLESGVQPENLIGDSTRNTLLSLHVQRPTPWGYRNEINVNIGTQDSPKLIDIATIEYLLWRPIFEGDESQSKNIIGLEESHDGVSICAVGLERLCMVVNGLTRVQDVDYIAPFYQQFGEGLVAGESLRSLHRIYSDIEKYGCNAGRHQKEKIRNILRNLPLDKLNDENLRNLLMVHSETQPWHPELLDGVEPTIERINVYRNSKRR